MCDLWAPDPRLADRPLQQLLPNRFYEFAVGNGRYEMFCWRAIQGDPGDEDVIPISDPAVVDLDRMKGFTGANASRWPRARSKVRERRGGQIVGFNSVVPRGCVFDQPLMHGCKPSQVVRAGISCKDGQHVDVANAGLKGAGRSRAK